MVPDRLRGRISAVINNPNPGAAVPRWFMGRNCNESRRSSDPITSEPGSDTAPDRSASVNGADGWSWSPSPIPSVSTADRSKMVGEWIAPALSTTRSAATVDPSTSRTPQTRR